MSVCAGDDLADKDPGDTWPVCMSRPIVLLAGLGVWGWAEWQNQRWSREVVTSHTSGRVAVVVLGFRNRGRRLNRVNRWRVAIGLRTLAAYPGGLLVLSGGATSGGVSEARLLAEHVRAAGYAGEMVLEEQSRTTWENVAHVLPLVEDFDAIAFASQPSHALKARAYVLRQRPDLSNRLTGAQDYRLFEHPLMKIVLALYGQYTLHGVTTILAGNHDENER